MIELYYWTTPNGHKITIFLEESGLPYTIAPVKIGAGEQFRPSFWPYSQTIASRPSSTAIRKGAARRSRCSNPARSCFISPKRPGVSSPPTCAGASMCCSGFSGRCPGLGRWLARTTISASKDGEIAYAIDRYVKETNRLYGVLNKRLADRPFCGGRLLHRGHGRLSLDRAL